MAKCMPFKSRLASGKSRGQVEPVVNKTASYLHKIEKEQIMKKYLNKSIIKMKFSLPEEGVHCESVWFLDK